MSLSSIEFILQETAANIYRNRLQMLAAISTVAITLIVLGSFVYAARNLTRLAGTLPSEFEITVHLTDKVSHSERDDLQKELEAIPGIKSVTLKTKEQVYAEQKKWLGKSVDLSGIEYNPQTDEFHLRIADIANTRTIVDKLEILKKGDAKGSIDEIVAAQDEAGKLARVIRFLRYAGIVLTAFLIFATALIVSNALRLTIFARRREIRIMQLVGATNWFIRIPYILEGMFHGLAGAALACIVVMAGGNYLNQAIQKQIPFLGAWSMPSGIVGMLLLLGVILGSVGSFISIRRFLKV